MYFISKSSEYVFLIEGGAEHLIFKGDLKTEGDLGVGHGIFDSDRNINFELTIIRSEDADLLYPSDIIKVNAILNMCASVGGDGCGTFWLGSERFDKFLTMIKNGSKLKINFEKSGSKIRKNGDDLFEMKIQLQTSRLSLVFDR